MSLRPPEGIAERLNRAEVAIINSLEDPTIAGLLAAYGYDNQRIAEGQALYNQAHDLHRAQEREYGEQHSASAEVEAARTAVEATYTPLLTVARVALRNDPNTVTALDLQGRRKTSLTGWIDQVCRFYTNALAEPAILDKLSRYNITAEKLQAGLDQSNILDSTRRIQEREHGDAQAATKARDAALDALDEWMSDFIEIARVALAIQPQLLEKLGILAPS